MKVLSISTDRGLFKEGSRVLERTLWYGSKIEELHIVVFTLSQERYSFKRINNVFIYPTSSLSQWFYVSNALRLGKKIIVENKFNVGSCVISTQDPFQTGWVGMRLAKKFGLPLQVQVHTDFLSPDFAKSFFNKIRVLIAEAVIPRATGIRVVNDVIRESIELKFGKKLKINTLPVFVDVESIVNAPVGRSLVNDFPQFSFTILMASRLTHEKKIDIALHALSTVVKEFPHTGLIIAGIGKERSKLEKLAARLDLARNVVFVGWQNDLVSYYKTANMFLLTSEYEGYGMTLAEAGASGCPIVTTKVGLAKSPLFISGENCKICPVGDVSCVAESILELIHNNSTRELFRREMRDSITNISLTKDAYVDRYVDLLESLIK